MDGKMHNNHEGTLPMEFASIWATPLHNFAEAAKSSKLLCLYVSRGRIIQMDSKYLNWETIAWAATKMSKHHGHHRYPYRLVITDGFETLSNQARILC